MFLFGSSGDSLLVASRGERSEAIETLIAATRLRKGYYLLLTLAVLIITPGLLLNNAAVIIGGMVLAPLLAPILLLALSLVTRSMAGITHSLTVLAVSVLIVLSLSGLLAWIGTHADVDVMWIPERPDPFIYAFIALCSGIAAAFAWVKKDLSMNIAGVAISVSLLPPLCAAGIGLALAETTLAADSAILFGTNVAGIILGAGSVFLLMHFTPTTQVEKQVTKEG